MIVDKRILNILVIIFLSVITFSWTTWIFHYEFSFQVLFTIISLRLIFSYFIYNDYSLSWSKATGKSFLIKSMVYIGAFVVYMPIFYGEFRIAFFLSELFLYLFMINFSMYAYSYMINRRHGKEKKSMVIYGAGSAGLKIENELRNSEYKLVCFIDDDVSLQKRSIDGVEIVSLEKFKEKNIKVDLLIVAIPSAKHERVKEVYEKVNEFATTIKVLPSLENILQDKPVSTQLKNVEVEDLLARHPKGLDREKIDQFIQDKVVLVTGAGGSIGSEICRQCVIHGAKKLIFVEHSEYNLYAIDQELNSTCEVVPVMVSVRDKNSLESVFNKYSVDIVVHAAAYKHVPMVEDNIHQGISNNILGTKHTIDLASKYGVKKFVLVSTDKAVRPTNVMGTTKRICELYAQNKKSDMEIVAVRFGNVLGSSGSVIPKFKEQIQNGGPVTVTHPDITRYFMLIPEACELVLQAGSLGKGGEIFILDMGEPVKIVDLASKLIELSGAKDIDIEFSGLRPGEKLYEELLIDDTDCTTDYEGITVARATKYDIDKLDSDIEELVNYTRDESRLMKLKQIVPEFKHNRG